MSVKITKKGGVAKAVAKYEDGEVRVGVTKKTYRRKDGKSNAQLLGYHQFGGPNLPARRPLDVLKTSQEFKNAVARGVRVGDLHLAGAAGAAIVQARIRAGLEPELAPGTMAKRKVNTSDPTPLIDTQQMINAITYEVK